MRVAGCWVPRARRRRPDGRRLIQPRAHRVKVLLLLGYASTPAARDQCLGGGLVPETRQRRPLRRACGQGRGTRARSAPRGFRRIGRVRGWSVGFLPAHAIAFDMASGAVGTF